MGSFLKGKEKEFVAMLSYKAKQNGKDGKPKYQDVCFPVTKEFREKLYDTIIAAYKQEKELAADQSKAKIVEKIENANRKVQTGRGFY